MSSVYQRLDVGPVVSGALVGLAGLALVGIVAAATGAGDDDGSLVLVIPLLLAGLVGLAAAGMVAVERSRRSPLLHAAAAAVAAVLVAEAFVFLRQVVTDETISWPSAAAWLLLGLAAGIAGGLFSALRPRHRANSAG